MGVSKVPAIHEMFPDPDDLLALEPEEIAPALLRFLGAENQGASPNNPVKRGNMFATSDSPVSAYPIQYRNRVYEALAAAWVWLEREGMLLPAPGQQDP